MLVKLVARFITIDNTDARTRVQFCLLYESISVFIFLSFHSPLRIMSYELCLFVVRAITCIYLFIYLFIFSLILTRNQ